MRELSTCDFCGDDADGVYEVLPDDIGPVTAPRRLALCTDCEGLLSSVLEPVLDRLRAADTDGDSAATSRTESGPESERYIGSKSERLADPTQPPADPDAEGVQIEAPETAADDTDAEPAAEPTAETDAESADDSADQPDVESAAKSPDDSAGKPTGPDADSGAGSTGSKPAGYGKLIRLLQNREGSMPREALHALATNAYDMSDEAFEEIVDTAIENGDIQETEKGLQT